MISSADKILHHPVPEIDAPLLTPTRYVPRTGLAKGFPVKYKSMNLFLWSLAKGLNNKEGMKS